ncbi:multiubiquitin [Saccharothrix saharensis]|uniref:Multiubiquitin n=1 Tax=Saccharothrix saharensis TaxID=571190 RepID=A0A543JP03_9PSEU|nr:multiubiquitin domain-containing protein [Saccharothrix saharensis]TQM84508.1 multiubiquitin [Saccharothrix saharensis]
MTDVTAENSDTHRPPRHLQVTVNGQQVMLDDRRMTGLEIKRAAIAQGVAITETFQLSVKQGKHYDVVGNTDEVTVREGLEFLAVAPDDNS